MNLRSCIDIVESAQSFPRLWLGPDGEVIDCDKADRPHGLYVAENPEMFGLSKDYIDKIVLFWDENEIEFDYEYVIALAEGNGWVRTSRDSQFNAAVSAGNLVALHRGIEWLADNGYVPEMLSVEIEQFFASSCSIFYTHYDLDSEILMRFLKFKRLPPPRNKHSVPVDLPE